MRHNSLLAIDDPEVVADLVRANPWATLASEGEDGIVASHYPVLLDEEADGLVLLTHLGRPDEVIHELEAGGEILVIVQGQHGYVSPSWYAEETMPVPTWNFTVAHCYGEPQVLGEEENLAVLARLVEHFERQVAAPRRLDPEWAAPIARGTVGLRIPVERFICKRKLSQNKSPASRRQVIAALRQPGHYHQPDLADEMERELDA